MGRGRTSAFAEEARAEVGASVFSSALTSPCTVPGQVAMGPFFPLVS